MYLLNRQTGVLGCFLLSGLAALIYETAWTREFAFVFGTSELAVGTVLAAYMGGLAAGAAVAGRWAHRIRRPLLAYGLLEIGIAVCALLVPVGIRASSAFSVVLFGGQAAPPDAEDAPLALYHLLSSFLILGIPTAMMGATLPLLARYAVRQSEQLGSRVGALYATNTAGAVLGTLAAAFFLLPTIGLRNTVWVGIGVNAMVFAIAVLLARTSDPLVVEAAAVPHRTPERQERRNWILILIMLSGICSFSYEILWTRLLTQILGASVYAFATMLASFLAGIALGSAVAARLATTIRRGIIGFSLAQLGIAALSVTAFLVINAFPEALFPGGSSSRLELLKNAALAGAVLLPPAMFIGATFPLAVRVFGGDGTDAGRSSGFVLAWNTVGAIIGSIGASFVLIPALGFADALRAILLLNLLVGTVAAAMVPSARRWLATASAGFFVAALLITVPEPENVLRFGPLGVHQPGEIRYLGIGRSANVLTVANQERFRIFTNGLPEAVVRRIHQPTVDRPSKWLGALPVLVRPEARTMLVIGFGGGRALERVPGTIERIDVVELEEKVLEANRSISNEREIDPFSDRRIRVFVNDARGALLLTEQRYDIIVSQPSHPWTSGASHLYTRDFFELVDARLNDDGVFVQWIILNLLDESLLRSLLATMRSVFPHVQLYRPPLTAALLLVGSRAPFDVATTTARAIRNSPDELARIGVFSPEDALTALALDDAGTRALADGGQISTDDYNLLQLQTPTLSRSITLDELNNLLLAHDPIPANIDGLNPYYLTRRLLAAGALERVKMLHRMAPEGGDGLFVYGSAGLKFRQRDARAALAKAIEVDPTHYEALAAVTRLSRQTIAAQGLDVVPALANLPPQALTVVQGWQLEQDQKWKDLEEIDASLAQIPITDPMYLDANRLRATWRMHSDDPVLRDEAIAMLDVALLFQADAEDFVARASLALQDGYPHYAVSLLESSLALLHVSSRPRHVVSKALELLHEVPPAVATDPRYARLRRRLERLAAR